MKVSHITVCGYREMKRVKIPLSTSARCRLVRCHPSTRWIRFDWLSMRFYWRCDSNRRT